MMMGSGRAVLDSRLNAVENDVKRLTEQMGSLNGFIDRLTEILNDRERTINTLNETLERVEKHLDEFRNLYAEPLEEDARETRKRREQWAALLEYSGRPKGEE